MGQDAASGLTIQAIVDLVDRHDPAFLAAKREQHPELTDTLTPGKPLGTHKKGGKQGLEAFTELAAIAVPAARQDGEKALEQLRAKSRMSSRVRLGSAVLSSSATLAMLGLLISNTSPAGKIVAGAVAMGSSLLTLVAQYRDEVVGNGETISTMRATLIGSLLELERIEGDLRVEAVVPGTISIPDLASRLSVAVSKVRSIELAML